MRHTSSRFELTFRIDYERLNAERCCDGIFPLITNELSLSERDLLRASNSSRGSSGGLPS